MTTTIQVRQRGSVTLPVSLRQKYRIETGSTFRLVDLGGSFLLTPMVPLVPDLAHEIERLREDEGVSMETLLSSLRSIREDSV